MNNHLPNACAPSTRRAFLQRTSGFAAGLLAHAVWTPQTSGQTSDTRQFHLSVSADALTKDPELLEIVRSAGITDVWLACFFHGHWHHSIEEINAYKKRIQAKGLRVHNITIPLGHPSFSETPPDYTANVSLTRWRQGFRPDGRAYYGVSLHPPATQENVAAVREIKTTDPGIIFLDDDFRLAPSPNDIGGCFCDVHREQFLRKHGYGQEQWDELLADVHDRRLTPLSRNWVTDTCDALTASFRAQQEAAAPEAQLGIMVMYLGSEKAGIRLPDYTNVPFRVGELMFDDKSFRPVKGKTNELFSALFHRRFVRPELAFSETTAWPPDGLSAPNMAAKLAITTICDVRNTMFMSGITPFPRTHWETLAPAMRKQTETHRHIAGHKPVGPFKHYWGEASRWIGDANPYSLFLATGVPFEVVDRPPRDGWTFLSEWDVAALAAKRIRSEGTKFVSRSPAGGGASDESTVAESLDDLFAFKQTLIPHLHDVPYVKEDVPMVCAWYPTARSVLLWNLTEREQNVTLCLEDQQRNHTLAALDTVLVRDIS